ncbi:DNA-binding NarL/FixJ family response regulator [Umezawaea tangerina]|uniref:DNA-binding NarL/FixJ family response regulator n=1 Tax=Umezawaea tangerina TaxID=84725 RepID=A0A2T0S5F5_9PSEU|nr:DNA-binding NarL/FixJ family response regulator [Umezawaea tangerina]
MRLVGTGLLRAVLAAGLSTLGWTCVHEPAGVAECAAVIIHDDGTSSTDVVAECVARALPTVVVGSVRRPHELIVAVHAGATSVVDRDLPVPDLLAAVQRGLTTTTRSTELVRELCERARLRERLDRLTPRERTVLTGLAAGRAAAEIARQERVTIATARAHIRSILLKLGVSSQLAAAAAGRSGWRELNLADHSAPCPTNTPPPGFVRRFRLLSDDDWSPVRGLFPARTGRPGRPFADARSMVEGVLYRYRCGIAWREVPVAFGPWQTIWTWHRRMSADAVLSRLCTAVDPAMARAHRLADGVTRTGGGWVELRLSDTG